MCNAETPQLLLQHLQLPHRCLYHHFARACSQPHRSGIKQYHTHVWPLIYSHSNPTCCNCVQCFKDPAKAIAPASRTSLSACKPRSANSLVSNSLKHQLHLHTGLVSPLTFKCRSEAQCRKLSARAVVPAAPTPLSERAHASTHTHTHNNPPTTSWNRETNPVTARGHSHAKSTRRSNLHCFNGVARAVAPASRTVLSGCISAPHHHIQHCVTTGMQSTRVQHACTHNSLRSNNCCSAVHRSKDAASAAAPSSPSAFPKVSNSSHTRRYNQATNEHIMYP